MVATAFFEMASCDFDFVKPSAGGNVARVAHSRNTQMFDGVNAKCFHHQMSARLLCARQHRLLIQAQRSWIPAQKPAQHAQSRHIAADAVAERLSSHQQAAPSGRDTQVCGLPASSQSSLLSRVLIVVMGLAPRRPTCTCHSASASACTATSLWWRQAPAWTPQRSKTASRSATYLSFPHSWIPLSCTS
jgi:hypothetical protein